MPFFVVTLPPSPDQARHLREASPGLLARLASTVRRARWAPGNSFQVLSPAPGGSEHATREEAKRALEERQRRLPDLAHVLVEAQSVMEAFARAQTPGGDLPSLILDEVRTWEQMQAAFRVRQTVFVLEQGVSVEEEIDEHDLPRAWARSAVHVLGSLDRVHLPVATARLLIDAPPGALPHIGRVAVLPEYRRLGYGTALMRWLEAEARRRDFPGVTLAAQLHAMPFYESLGYAAHGPVFLDAGIEHREMELRWG